MSDLTRPDPWTTLRRFTRARIALGRSGAGLPTAPMLDFALAHAQARDAVHAALDTDALHDGLRAMGLASVEVQSAATDRDEYLRRPDLGRRLGPDDVERLRALDAHDCDLLLVIGDGLSATAVERNALPLIDALRPLLRELRLGPVVLARQARVALGDAIGETLHAPLVAMLIGERPGLSATDSLGIYLTWQPRIGRTDAERNCISNIRPGGLDPADAARRIALLIDGARRLGATGVALQDESDAVTERPRRLKSGDVPPLPDGGAP